MPLWRLPDHFSDVLPTEARHIESLRQTALNVLRTWGYEMVTPPLLEKLEALTTGTAQDLDAVMFKVVDPISGTLLGIRADVTPQAARIDAHLLNRSSPTRLCYCTPAIRSQVTDAFSQRELLQLGAELFGHEGVEADIEIQDLVVHLLGELGITSTTLALSHSGVLEAAFEYYPSLKAEQPAIIQALRSKNRTMLASICKDQAFAAIPLLTLIIESYGTADQINPATFAQWPKIVTALALLQALAVRAQAQGVNVVIDLADLTGYGYHTGVQFSIYVKGSASSLVRGGRYDAVGQVFGRARAATGFSLDLRSLVRLLPTRAPCNAILAPWDMDDRVLEEKITALRQQGEIVVRQLPGQAHEHSEFLCDRHLVSRKDGWLIQKI